METTKTAFAGAATGTGVIAGEVSDVLEVLEGTDATDVLEMEEGEVEEETEVGVPAGQSEPASAGGVHPMISK